MDKLTPESWAVAWKNIMRQGVKPSPYRTPEEVMAYFKAFKEALGHDAKDKA